MRIGLDVKQCVGGCRGLLPASHVELRRAQRTRAHEREGLALLERAMEIDPDAVKPACERAYAWLCERKENELAEEYAERWRRQDALEAGA